MFKLSKANGILASNPFESHIPAGTSLDTNAEKINGTALTITAGSLEVAATGNAIAGVLAVEPGDTSYGVDEQGNALGNTAFIGTDDFIPFIPAKGDVLFEADLDAAGAVVIGAAYDIAAGGQTIDRAASVNGDFRVLKVSEGTTASATKVIGVFTNFGYFAG